MKHLSHLFRKSGTHLRLLLLQPLLLPLQACRRREERSLQNSETMPTVATLSFPPRQANNCDQSSAISILMKIISQPKNSLFVISPSISLSSPFQNQAPNSNVKCHRTVDCREYTVTECPVTKGVHQTNTQITHSFRSKIFSLIFCENVSTPKHSKATFSHPKLNSVHTFDKSNPIQSEVSTGGAKRDVRNPPNCTCLN